MLPESGVGWANHGQAKALSRAQIQIVKLLGNRVPVAKQAELRNAPRADCHEVLSHTLPGARMWPLHDPLVNRVFWLNISRERCRSCSSFLRLDRGPRFLDLARLHYGEEVAFLFAWHSHYIYVLAAFVAVTVPFIIVRTVQGKGHIDHTMLPHSLLTIIFGVALTEFWRPKARRLVHRWHAHGDCNARWQRLVLDLLEANACQDSPKHGSNGRSDDSGQTSPWGSDTATPRSMDPDVLDGLPPGPPEVADEGGADRIPSPGAGRETHIEDSQGSLQVEVEMPSGGVAPYDDVPTTHAQRQFRGKQMSQLEAAAVDACIDTFGIHTPQNASRWRHRSRISRQDLKRILKSTLILPILLLEWVMILVFFSGIVWFEIWVIFDWGGCREYNMQFDDDDWRCLSADQLRGVPGIIMGALPSIAEGVFFELLLLVSKVTSRAIIRLYHFRTREQHDFAVVTVIFMLEIIGKVGFILVLGLGFVPVWTSRDWTFCRDNWDYFIMGEWSLGCLKGQIPFQVRLKLFESIMKGPMWVSGMVGIIVKTLLPFILSQWRRSLQGPTTYEDGCGCGCRRYRVARVLLAPFDFVLRVSMLILQADRSAVGGLRLICRWPPAVAKHQPPEAPTPKELESRLNGYSSSGIEVTPKQDYAEKRAKAKRARLCAVLLEGERREHEPFDEYIELLLHFLWTSCFAIVWPLGCVFSLLNQILEFRFDCVKLLAVRRRRFPSTRHMSVAWVPRFARIICHISILVNIALLLMSYRQLLIWSPGSCQRIKDGHVSFLTACKRVQIVGAFLGTWACFLVVHFLAKCVLGWFARRPSPCCTRWTPGDSRIAKAAVESPASRRSSRSPASRRVLKLLRRLPDASPESMDSLGMRAAAPSKYSVY